MNTFTTNWNWKKGALIFVICTLLGTGVGLIFDKVSAMPAPLPEHTDQVTSASDGRSDYRHHRLAMCQWGKFLD